MNEYGIEHDVATDPANKGRFDVQATVDFSVAAVEQKQREYREKYAHQNFDGYRWGVQLIGSDNNSIAGDVAEG